MAKKIFLRDENNVKVLPITRGELILDSSGNPAFHSNEFLATDSQPGLMSPDDKQKLETVAGNTVDTELSNTSTNPVQNKVLTQIINSIREKYLKSAVVSGNKVTITDQSNNTVEFVNSTYQIVTNAVDGLVPKYDAVDGTIDAQTTDWVLTNHNGTLGWYKLPTAAFSSSSVQLFVGAKSTSNNNNSNSATTNGNTYLKLFDNSTLKNQYNIKGTGLATVISDASGTITINVPTSHNQASSDINSLIGYSKATAVAAIATTDSLNSALGKLELKADTTYELVKGAYDGDGTIENLAEILKVLEGIKDTETIQAIIGKYLPLTGGELTGSISYSFVTSGGDATGWWYKNNETRVAGIGALGDLGNLQHVFLGWGTSPWLESNSLAVSDTKLKYKGFDIIHTGNYNQFTVSKDNIMTYVNNNTDYVAANLPSEISKVAVSKYIEYWDGSTGGNGWFNSKWGTITAVNGFVGNITGDVTGNVTGNASSATKLQNARTIWGQSFNGTNNVCGDLFLHPQNNDGNALSTNLVFTGYNGYYYGPIIGTKNTSNSSGWGRKDLVFLQHNNSVWPTDATSHIEVMRITTNGWIGVGTSTPCEHLDVLGKIRSKGLIIHDHGGANHWYYTKIATVYQNQSPNYLNGAMVFYTMYESHEAGSEVERMRISASGAVGIGVSNPGYQLHVNGLICSNTGFVKTGSSNDYILLGGGDHKAISDFMLKSDELTNNLTTITKTLTVTKDWMDTGIKYTDLTTGTYAVQVYSYATNNLIWDGYWSGVMTWYGEGTNSSESDEILLHRGAHAYNGNTIYLRTINTVSSDGRHMRLQIAANKNFSSATYTFKFKKLI